MVGRIVRGLAGRPDSTADKARHALPNGVTFAFDSDGCADYGRPRKPLLKRLIVTKAELGIKRLCPNCGARYYDLNRDPIVCPRCGTEYEAPAAGPAAKARPQAARPEAAEDEAETEAVAPAAELVSLEEADEEATDSGAVKVDLGDDDEAIESDDEEDDTFLAEDEDEENDDDVSGIIGDVDEDET
jgi:uncharacterized protein (TIGR02300 family)